MDELAARTGRRYGLVDYHGAADAERVIVVMGSAAGAVEETVDALVAARRAGRRGDGPALPPVPGRRSSIAALPPTVRADRRPRPDQGARRRRRAALPRGRGRARASGWTGRAAVRDASPGHRRPLRPVVARKSRPSMVKAVFDELARRSPEAPLHRRHLRRRHPPQPADRPRVPPAAPGRRGPGRVLRARLRRHRRGQQGLGQDHRRGHRPASPRATSSTTRRSRAR